MNGDARKGVSISPAAVAAITAAAAFVVRLLHVYFTGRLNPLARSLQLDSATYDRWARALAFGGDPGPTTLMQAPVYPWFLSLLYRVFGANLDAVRLVQALLGTASCVLVALVTLRLLRSATAALLAGLCMALYAPLVFYEGILLPATLIVFLNVLALWLLAVDRPPGTVHVAAGGVALGAAVAANPTTALFAPFALLHLWFVSGSSGERHRATFARPAILLAAGTILALAPGTIRNYARFGEFVPLTTGGGINFYIGNNPGANGYYAPPVYRGASLGVTPEEQWQRMREIASRESGRELSESQVSRFWLDAGLRFIRENPAKAAALFVQKKTFFWNRYERANVESLSFHRRFPGVLRLPLLNFGIVAPLGLLGIFLTRSRWKRLWLLYGGIVAYAVAGVVFYVLGRYRLPIVPFLVPFAAAAVVELVAVARRRHFAELALLGAALAILAVFSNFTVARDTPQGTAGNLVRLGDAYLSRADTTAAERSYREALSVAPDFEGARRRLESIGR